MDLATMKTIIRRELRDEDAQAYRWSDDELGRHIAHAVRDFSEAVPLEEKETMATAAGSRELDISSLTERVTIEAVEYPAGKFPRQYRQFSLWGESLTILGGEIPDGSDCCIYYARLHALDAESSTIPAKLEDLVAAGAEGYAAISWSVYAVNRVNAGGTATPEEFLNWGKEKLRFFRAELKRLGRQNRVRARQLYTPCRAPVSKTTDYGP